MNEYSWPECFLTGVVPADRPDAALCADALAAWGNCIAGNKPPAAFGVVMVDIARRLNCGGTPEEMMKVSKRFLAVSDEAILAVRALGEGACA